MRIEEEQIESSTNDDDGLKKQKDREVPGRGSGYGQESIGTN